ncbi:type II toxin-antitoxin system Phd/YefM family antitoxin [Nostoc sp. DedSLP03]|uniref:type II toxin-antitoxin system Phd/YefM family antitoxin n=1 Tax=Nostoc sp. DedSLP03 TaxID=3075400 RepID=UPI003A10180D
MRLFYAKILLNFPGDRSNAILLAEKDWSAIQETLYLLSVPGMRESIKEGLATLIQECDGELNW